MKLSILAVYLLLSSFVSAAPLPMTGSALINQIQSGTALSQMGFQVQKFPTTWILKNPLSNESHLIETGPNNPRSKTLLSFRTESLSPKTDLEKYVRQYLRDYNQYGFEVIGLQSLKQNGMNTVIVDLNQKNKLTRSRQVFYKKDGKIVTATCFDDFDKFNATLATCNAILETFQWH